MKRLFISAISIILLLFIIDACKVSYVGEGWPLMEIYSTKKQEKILIIKIHDGVYEYYDSEICVIGSYKRKQDTLFLKPAITIKTKKSTNDVVINDITHNNDFKLFNVCIECKRNGSLYVPYNNLFFFRQYVKNSYIK